MTFTNDNILEREVYLFKNKQLFKTVMLGIEQSDNGQVKSLGSFSQYVEQIALDPRVRGDDTK